MSSILAMLDVLGELEKAARRHELNRDDAAAAIGLFRNFADRCHHSKEEKQLFPAWRRRGCRWKTARLP